MTHWSEDPCRSAVIEQVVDDLPPRTWRVFIWTDEGGNRRAVEGRLDGHDRNRLIDAIAQVLQSFDMDERTTYSDNTDNEGNP